MKDMIQSLVDQFGNDAVRDAALQVLGRPSLPLPADYLRVLSAEELTRTVQMLDAVLANVESTGQVREAAYSNKADLLQQKLQLETEVDLAKAEALMEIEGEGKTAFAMLGDHKVPITNAEARDAFCTVKAKGPLQRLAEVKANLAALDMDQFKANDAWTTVVESSAAVQKKAGVQAALLTFLANRG